MYCHVCDEKEYMFIYIFLIQNEEQNSRIVSDWTNGH